jgi:hypothetical protein
VIQINGKSGKEIENKQSLGTGIQQPDEELLPENTRKK